MRKAWKVNEKAKSRSSGAGLLFAVGRIRRLRRNKAAPMLLSKSADIFRLCLAEWRRNVFISGRRDGVAGWRSTISSSMRTLLVQQENPRHSMSLSAVHQTRRNRTKLSLPGLTVARRFYVIFSTQRSVRKGRSPFSGERR